MIKFINKYHVLFNHAIKLNNIAIQILILHILQTIRARELDEASLRGPEKLYK